VTTFDKDAPAEAPKDLNVVDPAKPCVPLPELVAIACPECMGGICEVCGSLGAVLIDKARLRVLA
jgi:hypothetical protein